MFTSPDVLLKVTDIGGLLGKSTGLWHVENFLFWDSWGFMESIDLLIL